MKTYTAADVMTMIRTAIDKAGSQAEFARQHDIGRGYLNDILTGRKELSSKALLDAVGVRPVPQLFERIPKD